MILRKAEKMADPNPNKIDEVTQQLHKLYREVGQLIALHEASKAPRIIVDGDIEIAWPQSVRDEIAARIITKTAAIEAKVAALKNG